MTCATSEERGLIGTFFFSGIVGASLILPKLSDKYGRKPITLIGSIFAVAASFICIFGRSVPVLYLSQFMQGFGMSGRQHVGYLYMAEHFTKNDVAIATGVFFAIDSLSTGFAAVYFQYISDDWRYLLSISTGSVALATFFLFCQDETPKFHHGIGNYKKSREILTNIGRSNRLLSNSQSFDKLFS